MSTKQNQPNIVLIMADQLTGMAMPMNGNPVVKAPNLQQLAKEGVNFENAYCNNPVCAPSRASLLTGLLSSEVGAYDNGAPFASEIPTIGHYLISLGYTTTLTGKMHFVGADQNHGYEDRLNTDIYPSDYGWTADWAQQDEPFAPSVMTVRGVIEAGACKRCMQTDHDEEVAYTAVQKIYDLARRQDKKPFFLTASFTNPHNPYVVEQKYLDMYTEEEINMPDAEYIEPELRDAWSKRYYQLIRQDEHYITEDHVRKARHAYYAMTSYIDDLAGRVITALKETDQYENTIIIFTADHGDMLGERGMWYKFNPFEWSVRVPYIIKTPDAKGGQNIKNPVSNLDIVPTLLDYVDEAKELDYVEELRGTSLRNVINGKEELEQRLVPIEFTGEGVYAPACIIRGNQYKFIHCGDDPEMLFDMNADPLEQNNLVNDPSKKDELEKMQKALHEIWDLETLQKTIELSQKRRIFMQNKVFQKPGANYPEWDYQVVKDATKQYVRSRSQASTALTKALTRLPFVPSTPVDVPRHS